MGVPDNRIPEDKLPQCWWDDVRMNALFAPFRVKSANPESWDMKMKFWSDMLRLWCRCKKDPVVSAADAKLAFRRKDRTAASIDIFIEEMLRSGELSPISKYQQVLHNGPEGWVRWGARLAFKPAAFALTAVSSLLPARQALDSDGLPKASIDSTQRFVLESAVKEQAVELLNNFPPGVERVGTVETLMQASRWEGSRETFQILLGYLVTQGQAVSKGDFIKLAEPSKKVAPLSSTDEGLAKLVDAETRLEDEATRLAHEISVAESEARASVAIGNKVAAKNHLRRRHRLQQRLTRCENTLENVRHLLQGMRDVDINASIVDTYKTSSEAMRRGMKENGLTEDAVYETLDGLNDVMETYNAVEKALSNVPDDFDNEELEMELKDLISGRGGGGTPGRDKPASTPTVNLPSTPENKIRKTPEDFIFDGEERVIAELNALSVHDASPKVKPVPVKPVAVATTEKPSSSSSSRPSQAWYPPSDRALNLDAWSNEASPVRQDDRIHPGQKLNVDFTSPPRFYSDEFQVQDHKLDSGVWLFNKDSNSNYPGIDEDKNLGLAQSTEYFSSESPGKSGGSFQMAPGGERKKSVAKLSSDHEVDQLQKRLNNLRGFNL